MRIISFKEKIADLGVPMPPEKSFWRMGDLTALRRDDAGRFYRSNFERGPLLYGLVAKDKPKVFLEFGTGRGYGSLCAARAMVEHGIDGKIFTIDVLRYDQEQLWWIDCGPGPEARYLSCKDVWPRYFDAAWLQRITCLNGHSFEVMERWRERSMPQVDFAFVDGEHRYEAVKHDFYSLLDVSAPRFHALFDDYVDKPKFGVRKLIDEEIDSTFHTELIYQRSDGSCDTTDLEGPPGGMVLIDSDRVKVPWRMAFTDKAIGTSLARMRRGWRRRRAISRAKGALRPLVRLLKVR